MPGAMATVAQARDAGIASDACFHCGEALPSGPARCRVDGVEREFCCEGCSAAAEWIREARLGDYYRLRTAPASRVVAEADDLALWDREDVLATHARPIAGGREITLLTDGMHCAACAWLIDRALSREPGVLEISANAVTGRIRIAWDPTRTPLSAPLGRLSALGYRPFLATGDARERARRAERNRWLLRLGAAGLGAMQAMMFAEALYLDTQHTMSLPMRDFLRWVTFLVATPVVFWAGWPFLAGCARELRLRRPGMDTLVAISVLLAYGASVAATVSGGPHVWYDAAVMFVFLLLAARMLEQRVRNQASAQVDALARARPAFAVRECGDGARETVPLAAIAVGDVLRIGIGDAVPADGVLLGDEARFEESLLTGEPQAVCKQPGMPVFAGTTCHERPARVQVSAVGAATRLSQLTRLVEQAQAHRPALARAADRVAGVFVAGLLAATCIIYIAWRVHDPARAFDVALALLVISCPCALSLAVPAALAAANGTMARLGVLPVSADAIDRLARTTDVVFDKTGTLSDGTPSITGVDVFAGSDRDTVLRIASALERDSGHPLAAAVRALDSGLEPCQAESVVAVPGAGIEGVADGRAWRLGHAPFACEGTDDGALWLGDGKRAVARFEVGERTRADATGALRALRDHGLGLHLCSGDAPGRVDALASALGIQHAHARQTPEAKLARVHALQAQGRVVAMVGDGLNDAPVLAGADVSIAMGEGAALAQRAADLVLTAPSLTRIPDAILLARRTRAIVRQNFAWAIAYNVVALPLAALGLVTPWLAATGMALSSLLVTLNALRLARPARTQAPEVRA